MDLRKTIIPPQQPSKDIDSVFAADFNEDRYQSEKPNGGFVWNDKGGKPGSGARGPSSIANLGKQGQRTTLPTGTASAASGAQGAALPFTSGVWRKSDSRSSGNGNAMKSMFGTLFSSGTEGKTGNDGFSKNIFQTLVRGRDSDKSDSKKKARNSGQGASLNSVDAFDLEDDYEDDYKKKINIEDENYSVLIGRRDLGMCPGWRQNFQNLTVGMNAIPYQFWDIDANAGTFCGTIKLVTSVEFTLEEWEAFVEEAARDCLKPEAAPKSTVDNINSTVTEETATLTKMEEAVDEKLGNSVNEDSAKSRSKDGMKSSPNNLDKKGTTEKGQRKKGEGNSDSEKPEDKLKEPVRLNGSKETIHQGEKTIRDLTRIKSEEELLNELIPGVVSGISGAASTGTPPRGASTTTPPGGAGASTNPVGIGGKGGIQQHQLLLAHKKQHGFGVLGGAAAAKRVSIMGRPSASLGLGRIVRGPIAVGGKNQTALNNANLISNAKGLLNDLSDTPIPTAVVGDGSGGVVSQTVYNLNSAEFNKHIQGIVQECLPKILYKNAIDMKFVYRDWSLRAKPTYVEWSELQDDLTTYVKGVVRRRVSRVLADTQHQMETAGDVLQLGVDKPQSSENRAVPTMADADKDHPVEDPSVTRSPAVGSAGIGSESVGTGSKPVRPLHPSVVSSSGGNIDPLLEYPLVIPHVPSDAPLVSIENFSIIAFKAMVRFDLTFYPFDSHVLSLNMFLMPDQKFRHQVFVDTKLAKPFLIKALEQQWMDLQWDLVPDTFEVIVDPNVNRVTMSIKVMRIWTGFVWNYILKLFLITISSYMSCVYLWRRAAEDDILAYDYGIKTALLMLLTYISFEAERTQRAPTLGYLTLIDIYSMMTLSVCTFQGFLHAAKHIFDIHDDTVTYITCGICGLSFLFHIWYVKTVQEAIRIGTSSSLEY